MSISNQLNDVMGAIWENDKNADPATKALASYVRNHARCNHENVFEVINILWPSRIRAIKQRNEMESHGNADYNVDIQFDDDSQVLVITSNGIGNAVEVIS